MSRREWSLNDGDADVDEHVDSFADREDDSDRSGVESDSEYYARARYLAGSDTPSTEALTPEDRLGLRAAHRVVHRPGIHGEESWCDEDNVRQPCDTQVVLGILDAERAERAVRQEAADTRLRLDNERIDLAIETFVRTLRENGIFAKKEARIEEAAGDLIREVLAAVKQPRPLNSAEDIQSIADMEEQP